MASAVSALYEPLIARDLPAVGPAVQEFRRTQSAEELALAVGRFAILAYAPSQHSKHAVLSVLSALELRDEYGSEWDDLLVRCAAYAASSRQPWSEPPLMDPPAPDDAPAGREELRAAVASRDRLRGEQWLAKRLDDSSVRDDLIAVGAEDLSDLGHKLIMVNAALKLAPVLGEKGKFATLRMAVWELTSYHGGKDGGRSGIDETALLDRLIARCVEEEGSLESAHAVFLFDAALECGALDRVAGALDASIGAEGRSTEPLAPGAPDAQRPERLLYDLGHDLGAALKSHAVSKRLRARFPTASLEAFVAAVHRNLEHGPSYEDWSFA